MLKNKASTSEVHAVKKSSAIQLVSSAKCPSNKVCFYPQKAKLVKGKLGLW